MKLLPQPSMSSSPTEDSAIENSTVPQMAQLHTVESEIFVLAFEDQLDFPNF